MAQVHEGKQSRWLVIRRSSSEPKRDEVVARIPDVEWEVARDVCLRKYGVRATLLAWEHASAAQRKAAELQPPTYIERPVESRSMIAGFIERPVESRNHAARGMRGGGGDGARRPPIQKSGGAPSRKTIHPDRDSFLSLDRPWGCRRTEGMRGWIGSCWLVWRGSSRDTPWTDRKRTRLNSSHLVISYAVFC